MCLWAHAGIITAFNQHDESYKEEQVDCNVKLVKFLPHNNVADDEAPSKNLPDYQCKQKVRTHEMAAAQVDEGEDVVLKVWPISLHVHRWNKVEGVYYRRERQLNAETKVVD